MKKAHSLAEMLLSCDPRPLERDELEGFFVNTAAARDPVMSRRDEIRKRLEASPDANTKVLLSGHGGCGKSTELVKLADEVQNTFFTVSFSVVQECNLFHVPVEDLLLVMMERLLDACKNAGLADQFRGNEETLRSINEWFATELQITEEKVEAGGSAEGGVDTSASLLGRTLGLFVKLKAFIRRADQRVHRMTHEKPHRLSELAERCNLLIKAVKQALHAAQRRLLIVIEDLDKVNLSDARRIFLEQPAVLAELACNMICTVPIFLLHSPDRAAFERHFGIVELPMLKVTGPDNLPCPEGRKTIREIVERRVAPELIQPDALELLIEKSGGVLRDVFEVLVVASGAAESLAAQKKQSAVVARGNVRYGLNRRKNEYARAITVIDLPKDWKLTIADLYKKLGELRAGPVRVLPSEPATMVLLKARAIMEYNGEGWFALHPLVVELLDSLGESPWLSTPMA